MLATSATIFLENEVFFKYFYDITLNIGIFLIFLMLSKFSMNGLSIKSSVLLWLFIFYIYKEENLETSNVVM